MLYKACEEDDNFHWAAYWGRKFRTHPFFGDAIIMIHVAEFMLGTGLKIIAVAVSPTQTGFFMDGFAMATTSKQLEKGQPVA